MQHTGANKETNKQLSVLYFPPYEQKKEKINNNYTDKKMEKTSYKQMTILALTKAGANMDNLSFRYYEKSQ